MSGAVEQTWYACSVHPAQGVNYRNPCPLCLETPVKKKPAAPVDHAETKRLLLVVDETGTNLTRGQIDFVADLIDRKVKKFTPEQDARVRKIYQKKVVEGVPERDEL